MFFVKFWTPTGDEYYAWASSISFPTGGVVMFTHNPTGNRVWMGGSWYVNDDAGTAHKRELLLRNNPKAKELA